MAEFENNTIEESTRSRILRVSLELFHHGSFASTSLNQIVAKAGITKGALFHYFKGKNELGYAVVDEMLRVGTYDLWIRPLIDSDDPIAVILSLLESHDEEMQSNSDEEIDCGCPLNNLAQEVSSVDDSFRLKLCKIYKEWEKGFEDAFKRGIEAGNVRADIDPVAISKLLVALIQGTIGMMKVHQEKEFALQLKQGVTQVLTLLKK